MNRKIGPSITWSETSQGELQDGDGSVLLIYKYSLKEKMSVELYTSRAIICLTSKVALWDRPVLKEVAAILVAIFVEF